MKKIILVSTLLFTGCASTELGQLPSDVPAYPTNEWLKNHYPTYQAYAKADKLTEEQSAVYEVLTKLVAHREREAIFSIEKSDYLNKELTMVYGNEGRGGAVFRQPAYIHVLYNKDKNVSSSSSNNANQLLNGDITTNSLNKVASDIGRQPTSPLSHYELSRWERYCNSGKGMDEKDWRFVKSFDYAFPSDVIGNCNQPVYDYEFYLSAWRSFCTASTEYGEKQKNVVRHSVKPQSLNIPCKV